MSKLYKAMKRSSVFKAKRPVSPARNIAAWFGESTPAPSSSGQTQITFCDHLLAVTRTILLNYHRFTAPR